MKFSGRVFFYSQCVPYLIAGSKVIDKKASPLKLDIILEEAMKNIQEAIDLYLEVSRGIAEKAAKGQPRSTLVEIAV